MLWIISGCITSRGFTLGKDARGHLPWNTLYVRFTSDLLRTNEDGCDLHEKSSERAPVAGSHSVPFVLEGGWVGLGRPPWWQPSFQGEQQRQLSGSQSRFGRKTRWMNWSGQPCSAKPELILLDLASAFMFGAKNGQSLGKASLSLIMHSKKELLQCCPSRDRGRGAVWAMQGVPGPGPNSRGFRQRCRKAKKIPVE